MQLEIRRGARQLRARVERAVEVDAVLAQRVGQRDPVAVGELAQLCRSLIEPAAADEPNSDRPKRAPSSSAQTTSLSVTGGSPSAAIRRITSTPASTFRQPSSQPPFGTESMCPPISSARSESPGSVNHWFPASSISSTAPVGSSLRGGIPRPSQVSVQATRWAPFSSPGQRAQLVESVTARQVSSAIEERS